MTKLTHDQEAIVEAMLRHDRLLGAAVEARLMQGRPVLNIAKRLEAMAKRMRELSLKQELNRP